MSSPLFFLNELYCRNAPYFQRMLEFFLRSRFTAVRIYCLAKPKESVFFSITGKLICCSDNNIQFHTLTDWYNSVSGKDIPKGDTSIFSEIHISKRMSMQGILSIVTHKEVEEFMDLKYRSSTVYAFVIRRLKARQILCKTTRGQSFRIHWQERFYTVQHSITVAEGPYSVGPFLDYVCDSETTLTGLFWDDGTGKRILLTEDIPVTECHATATLQTQLHMVQDQCAAKLELMADVNHEPVQQFADGLQEKVTAQLNTLREEMTSEMNVLRQQMYAELDAVRQHYTAELDAVQQHHTAELDAVRQLGVAEQNRIYSDITEFHKVIIADVQDIRMTIHYQQQGLQALLYKRF